MSAELNERPPGRRLAAAALPYLAVLAGLYWLQSAWIAMLAYHAGICLILVVVRDRPGIGALFSGFDKRMFALIGPSYLLAGVLIYFLWPVAKLEEMVLGDALVTYGLGPGWFLLFAVYTCTVNAAIEEIFWGGILAEQNRWPTVRDLLFGGYHGLVMALFVSGLWVAVSVVLLAVAAWVWRTMARWSGGLCVSWLTHVVADVGIMAAIYLLVD